jgi:uncharacterized 2Fe-2S/4Fe-4S cluster protein (DUF4445 family)
MQITLSNGKTVDILKGENLLHALKRQEIYLVASCGGKGICGKCRIKVTAGKYKTKSTKKLDPAEIMSGMTLACQTFPQEDILIDIPKTSELVVGDIVEVARSKDLFELFQLLDGRISPLVKRVSLEMPPPTFDNSISDLEQLKNALGEKGLGVMRFDRGFVSSLSQRLRDAAWKVDFGYTDDYEAVCITPASQKKRYGIAVDVGTTTIVVYLTDIDDGSLVDVGSTYNSQIRFGDDVITRIVHAVEGGGLQELQEAVVNDINNLIRPVIERHSISSGEITSAVIAGNTTMSHLFWALNPQYIREEPYVPVLNAFPLWNASSAGLQINEQAPVYTLPCVASYIGGDIVSGVLAAKMHRENAVSLFMDIGTNGEIVLGNNEWLVTAACSAGPCFEGSGIRHGMRATEGAIESVTIDPETFEPATGVIGKGKPAGICGSGMIDAITELFLAGLIDRKGRFVRELKTARLREGFEGPEFLFYSDEHNEIVLTEVDIENIMRAKAAVFAGISLLLTEVNLTFKDIQRVYIAGGFGNYLNIEKAIILGMLPDMEKEKFSLLGNTSVAGAYLCLLSEKMRKEAEEIAATMTNIELSVSRKFMDEYLSALFLPHTDITLFPTVESLLSKK